MRAINALAYRNLIPVTASTGFPLVSLLVRLCFKSIHNVLRSDQNRVVRLVAASTVAGDGASICRYAEMKHPRGGGGGGGGRKGGRRKALGKKARKKGEKEKREQPSTAAMGR